MSIRCPDCGASNPDNTWQCVCGHYFVTMAPQATPTISEAGLPPSAVAGESGASLEEPQSRGLEFHGRGGALLEIYIVNVLLSFLTLGIYHFWGKVKVRQYLYGQTEFEGDRFGYHGTGKELLIGWLKAMTLFGGFIALLLIIQMLWQGPWQEILTEVMFYAGMLLLVPIAVVGSQRYRLSRTSWRGLRFSFRGHVPELMRIFLRDGILTMLTASLYYPFFQNNLRQFLASNSYYGSEPFDYDGDGWELFKMYLLLLLLIFPTLGLYWFWYTAKKQRHYWDHTHFGEARFRSTVTGEGLAEIKITNLLLIVFTLGLGYPLARVRMARYQAGHLFLEGPLDLDAIRQQALAASATGDALAEMMDVSMLDVDLGF